MKYILTTVYHDEPMFIPTVPMNAKQEVCSENWKEEAFIAGAKWADENPQFSKEEFIEKACEWLEENVSKYSYVVKVEGTEYRRIHFTGALTEDFSKAMEG